MSLLLQEWEKGGANVNLLTGPSSEELETSPTVMLQTHRGYFIKTIENAEDMLYKKRDEIDERLQILKEAMEDKEKEKQNVS